MYILSKLILAINKLLLEYFLNFKINKSEIILY